jgi:HTH-type transcriptional regulator / antitoxin HipB
MMRSSNPLSPSAPDPGQEFILTDTAAIGDLIRRRRKQLGLNLRFLSAGTGLSLAFVHAAEHGKPTAEISKIMELLAALGIDLIARPR